MSKRKLKYLIVGVAAAVVVTGALTVWAAVAAFQYAGQFVSTAGISRSMTELPSLLPESCWKKTRSMMDAVTWLEVPLATNIQALKKACVEEEKSIPGGAT